MYESFYNLFDGKFMKKIKVLVISMVIMMISSINLVYADELTKKTCQSLYHKINKELLQTKITNAERTKAIKLRNKGLTECRQGKIEVSMKNLQESLNIIMQIKPTILDILIPL